jgi:hypothetical protein
MYAARTTVTISPALLRNLSAKPKKTALIQFLGFISAPVARD